MPADAYKFPPIVPAGEYRIDTRVYDGENDTYVRINGYGVIKAKGIHVLLI